MQSDWIHAKIYCSALFGEHSCTEEVDQYFEIYSDWSHLQYVCCM